MFGLLLSELISSHVRHISLVRYWILAIGYGVFSSFFCRVGSRPSGECCATYRNVPILHSFCLRLWLCFCCLCCFCFNFLDDRFMGFISMGFMSVCLSLFLSLPVFDSVFVLLLLLLQFLVSFLLHCNKIFIKYTK